MIPMRVHRVFPDRLDRANFRPLATRKNPPSPGWNPIPVKYGFFSAMGSKVQTKPEREVSFKRRRVMRTMRSARGVCSLLAVSLFLIPGPIPAAAAEEGVKGALDGRVFIVENGKKGGKDAGRDVFLFREGKFRSTIRDKWDGFQEGAYTYTRKEGVIAFAADTESRSRGTIHWEGTVQGDGIDVRYTWIDTPRWYQSKSTPTEYWAKGKEVKNPGGATVDGKGASSLLDGKTFFVRTGEKGKEADHDDYLIFRDGMCVSSGCVEQNFGTSAYSADADVGGIRFRAKTVSPTHGAMIWEGTVRGDAVDATARWVHKRWYWSIDRSYLYQGRLYE
jgi:hypothetical protein